MSELQLYYDNFCRTGLWSNPDPKLCGCRGRGWWLSDLDTFHKCHYHAPDAPHPEMDLVGSLYCPEDSTGAAPSFPVPDPDDDIPF